MGTIRVIVLAAVLGFLAGFPARGDGKAFARAGFGRAEIPEQRALIHWADGVETLVIESVVRAPGPEVAWVVPLPAVPESVAPASTAIFPTLQNLFQARVVSRADGTAWLLLAGAGLCWLVRALRLQGFRGFEIVLVLVAVVVAVGMVLPATSKAGIGEARIRDSSVTVLGRARAGVFDVTTLTARKPSDLLDWLRGQGFEAVDGLEPVVAEHLREGWVFVVARAVRAGGGAGEFAVHPLAFRFRVAEPVYPLRLTGVGSGPVRVDLYVFGPGRAEVEGLEVAYCGKPNFLPLDTTPRLAPLTLRIRQPELVELVRGAAVATKLRGTIGPAGMVRDGRVRWAGFRSTGGIVFTRWAARERAGAVAAGALFVGAAWAMGRVLVRGGTERRFAGVHALWCLGAALAGLLYYAALPRVEDRAVVRVGGHQWGGGMLDLAMLGMDALAGAGLTNRLEAGDADRALGVVRSELAGSLGGTNLPAWGRNVFTGETLREEPSPGNYTLAVRGGVVTLYWHDFDGAPVAPLEVTTRGRAP